MHSSYCTFLYKWLAPQQNFSKFGLVLTHITALWPMEQSSISVCQVWSSSGLQKSLLLAAERDPALRTIVKTWSTMLKTWFNHGFWPWFLTIVYHVLSMIWPWFAMNVKLPQSWPIGRPWSDRIDVMHPKDMFEHGQPCFRWTCINKVNHRRESDLHSCEVT